MSLKIGFLTTLGVNVGDEFIREGLRAALDAAEVDYTPLYVDKHDPASLHAWAGDETQAAADKFRASDLFLQSGAPVYWWLPGGHTSLTSEWHQWIWEERILAPGEGPIFANLGAGSCQPWAEGPEKFLADPACVDFARRAAARAVFTSVRDPLAAELLERLGVPHRLLGCPAFLAAARQRLDRPAGFHGPLGVNLMPRGGHFELEPFDADAWEREVRDLVAGLRRLAPLLFVAHDAAERDWLRQFATAGERVFLGADWKDYLAIYSSCSTVLANRVHGAVCAAGFGVPAVIVGNDSRARIGEPLGLPIGRSGHTSARGLLELVASQHSARRSRRDDLLARRSLLLRETTELLAPALALAEDAVRP